MPERPRQGRESSMDQLKAELVAALKRYAPAKMPENIMGGCCECGSTNPEGWHRPKCRWKNARAVIAKALAAKK